MELRLENKVALVCGSTRGIGLAIARVFADAGASVILVARNEEKLLQVKDTLSCVAGQSHATLAADFTYPDQLKLKLHEFLESQPPINILVNNSGGPPGGKAVDADIKEYESAFRQHLICNQILVQEVVEGMKESGYGRIINIISTSVKQPIPGLGVSNTIRGAVANWAKTLSRELAPWGITVNNILPGATETDRLKEIVKTRAEKTGLPEEELKQRMLSEIPLKRFARPEEIAHAALFLASPAAEYITGINLPVDGGRLSCL
ncbi:MAG: SDR family oxidoreductase [Calditrichaeota bacterium]|nr:MAG: SDR family oxidoreductase [Calditrichota bacterium]